MSWIFMFHHYSEHFCTIIDWYCKLYVCEFVSLCCISFDYIICAVTVTTDMSCRARKKGHSSIQGDNHCSLCLLMIGEHINALDIGIGEGIIAISLCLILFKFCAYICVNKICLNQHFGSETFLVHAASPRVSGAHSEDKHGI